MSKAAPVSDTFPTVQSITAAHPKMIDPPLSVRRRVARLASTADIKKYRVTNVSPYTLDFYRKFNCYFLDDRRHFLDG